VIEPVYPFQRRELHGLERAPGATSMNDLCFVGPLIVSARALSKESPTLPTDGSIPASAKRSVYLIETYWAAPVAVVDETGTMHRLPLMQGLLQGIQHEGATL